MLAAGLVTGLVTGLGACSAGEPEGSLAPAWIDLAHGFRPAPLAEIAAALEATVAPPRGGRLVPEGEALWFELPLPASAWEPNGEPGIWRMDEPRGGALLAGESATLVLLEEGTPLKAGRPRQPRGGRFWKDGDQLLVSVDEGRAPADGLVYRMRLDHGREVEGGWRVAQWDLACDGFLVLPGAPESLEVEIPAGSRLAFASVSPDPGGRGADLPPTRFRVRLDGRVLLEHLQPHARPVRAQPHVLELGVEGKHRLTFEVEGEAPAVIGTPRLVPGAFGRPGARPWPEARPDVVLVLCDTFRADNLAAWGGRPELAPRLNRFVERSVRFLDARAAAAWTLPSIGTIFSGVFPGQHGGTDLDRPVSPAVETLAEVLGRAGYRTVALTDSGLFSRHYGQDQGFQWFEETAYTSWNLRDTLARAREQMERDDGRPLFLVVHTYRVHGPMRSGPDEDLRVWEELRVRIRARMLERGDAEGDFRKMDVALEFADEGRALYEDAVSDLDAKVGAWLEELEGAGFLERGLVLLTADHGNSHGEHGQLGHGSDLYDVKLRVPLAIAGRGLAPRAVPGPVSLVSLAPTVTALAGVEPAPSWVGRSLLASEPGGPIYAFDLKTRGRQVALYAEGRKLMAPDVEALEAGRPSHAFDLGADPAEEENLAERMKWPAELARALSSALEPLLVPAGEGETLELPAEITEQLRAIGYGE